MLYPYTPLKKGQIYYANLNPVVGFEQGGMRPVLVVQNDIGNRYSPTTIVAAITSHLNKNMLPTHVLLKSLSYGLDKDSVVLLEQVRTIDRARLHEYMGHLDDRALAVVDQALAVSFDLNPIFTQQELPMCFRMLRSEKHS